MLLEKNAKKSLRYRSDYPAGIYRTLLIIIFTLICSHFTLARITWFSVLYHLHEYDVVSSRKDASECNSI